MLLTFVQHSNLKKKGISCSSVGRPVPPIRHSGLKKNMEEMSRTCFLL